jgi:hypothetical protein
MNIKSPAEMSSDLPSRHESIPAREGKKLRYFRNTERE